MAGESWEWGVWVASHVISVVNKEQRCKLVLSAPFLRSLFFSLRFQPMNCCSSYWGWIFPSPGNVWRLANAYSEVWLLESPKPSQLDNEDEPSPVYPLSVCHLKTPCYINFHSISSVPTLLHLTVKHRQLILSKFDILAPSASHVCPALSWLSTVFFTFSEYVFLPPHLIHLYEVGGESWQDPNLWHLPAEPLKHSFNLYLGRWYENDLLFISIIFRKVLIIPWPKTIRCSYKIWIKGGNQIFPIFL